MRLGQLSRKVNVKPTEILSYLKNEFDVEIGTHLNTKVEDALTEKVMAKFVVPTEPKVNVTIDKVEEVQTESIQDAAPTNVTPAPIELPIAEEESTESPVPELIEYESNEEVDPAIILNAELIKAPTVALTGPKVVGKIELPPTLEEQMVEVDGVMMSKADLANRKREERNERKAKREENKPKSKRSASTARNSRVKSEAQLEQMKRDQAADEMAKKLERREKRIAEKKKQVAKSKPVFVPKPTKKKSAATIAVEEKKKVAESKPKPTTWYGKLWLWFNT